ncbi:uncharacterized protein LOC143194087 [Rhynchophorus ferrugineus]|uniref:PH domain-containing protein n=1 Tax=Rhynchophorus ferrugineus TaxID=354439 RepID=A0A834MP74_RHYFE|nr:hypothetical protein GWI33_003445 [Rhynchophorus ferrugineus]
MEVRTSNNKSVFYDVDLNKQEDTRPKSAISRFQSFKDSFKIKRRHHTVAIGSKDIVKASISSPIKVETAADLSQRRTYSENAIACCPFDISGYGQFLMMDEFVVKKAQKRTLMVFLFEKIMIFTSRESSHDCYYFKDSIRLDELCIVPTHEKNVLILKNHYSSAKFHKDIMVKLQTPSEYIKVRWKEAIEKCLWAQFIKAKEESEKSKKQ